MGQPPRGASGLHQRRAIRAERGKLELEKSEIIRVSRVYLFLELLLIQ
jgi:hypothetical protein